MSQFINLFTGWAFGLLTAIITFWIRENKEKKNKEIEILSDTLKYLFQTKQIFNNLLTNKSVLIRTTREFPEKVNDLEKQMYQHFDTDIKKEFFSNLMYHSFQLQRLKEKSFYKDFEKIMQAYETFGYMVLEGSDMELISRANDEVTELISNFVLKCNERAKI